MNWQAISFDWNQVRAFWATAEEGSLSAAARVLGATQPTLSRQVAALETALGVTLFERSGKTLVITNAGRELLEHVKVMGDAASCLSMVASGQSQDTAGRVTITASDLFAAAYLPPILAKLREMAPLIDVTVIASNHIEDLTRRDADIAVRNVRPTQPDLIAKMIGDFDAGLYAATSYLDRIGRPQTPDDLAGHAFVGLREHAEVISFLSGHQINLTPDQFKATSDSGVVMWEMMRAGLGITVMPSYLWPDTVGVEQVLPDLPPIKFPVWLATHRELNTSRRIRVVFDLLAQELDALPRR